MDSIAVKNRIARIADVSDKFFIGDTNAPKKDCIAHLNENNYRNIEIITMSKEIGYISEIKDVMVEIFKTKGNYDKKTVKTNRIEGDTIWNKLFVAFQ